MRNADDMGMPPANAISAIALAASTPLDKERLGYVIQIMKAARDDGVEFVVDNLLMEYGAKAYRQGQRDMAAAVKKYVDGY